MKCRFYISRGIWSCRVNVIKILVTSKTIICITFRRVKHDEAREKIGQSSWPIKYRSIESRSRKQHVLLVTFPNSRSSRPFSLRGARSAASVTSNFFTPGSCLTVDFDFRLKLPPSPPSAPFLVQACQRGKFSFAYLRITSLISIRVSFETSFRRPTAIFRCSLCFRDEISMIWKVRESSSIMH